MTPFAYTAIPVQRGAGGVVRGREEARDEKTLRESLRSRGLVPIDVRPVRLGDAIRSGFSRSGVRRSDTLWFVQTLRLLLSSAVPLESALSTMEELAPNPRLAGVCSAVRSSLRGGSSLADAVGAQPGLLTGEHLALLKTGHESGRLAHVVELIDVSLSTRDRLRRTIVGRLIYPAILMFCAVIAVWFLATYVIPKFAETLQSLGGELPLPTRITLVGSKWLMWILPPVLIAGAVVVSLREAIVPASMRRRIGMLAVRLPIVGTLITNNQGAIVCDLVATMVEGGGDVLSGLGQAREVVSSPVISERLARAHREVREGADLGQAFAQAEVLPPLAAAVVKVGMRTGDLVGCLRRATQICITTQERVTERLLVFMEPAIVMFLAGVVGWVVYSLVVGMLAMNDLGAM